MVSCKPHRQWSQVVAQITACCGFIPDEAYALLRYIVLTTIAAEGPTRQADNAKPSTSSPADMRTPV
jgi:hypothetical protein